jgi:DNA-binding winged helix-turn-helix (wHTH) protein/TolB-like protein/Flp pilus assembly protein TadD
MNAAPIRGYRFDDHTLDLGRRRLSAPGQESLPLSGRAFEVLAYLLANRDRMVSKKELLDAVWPRMVVEENTLTQAISGLRRVLGDSRESPRYIATIAGRGYQFVGEATPFYDAPTEARRDQAAVAAVAAEVAAAPASPEPDATANFTTEPGRAAAVSDVAGHASPSSVDAASAGPAPVSRRSLLLGGGLLAATVGAGLWWLGREPQAARGLPSSIAVLPFRPLLAASRNEAIEIGIAELLINRLSALPGVVVPPLSSVRRFSAVDQDPLQAGRALDVAAVLDGTVQIEGQRVRLTARLLDVGTGESLWAGNYTEPLGEFFAMQDALVTQLVSALAIEASPELRARLTRHTTTDAEAWQLYANGRFQLEQRDSDSLARARVFFEAAVARDPRFALAITGLSESWALAGVFVVVPPAEALEQARVAAQRALAIDPGLPDALAAMGHVLTQLDHDWSGGRRLYEQSLALEPKAARTLALLALNLTQTGQLDAALERIDRAQALEPAAMPFIALAGWVRLHARSFDDAARSLGRLVEAAPQANLPRQFLARVKLAQGDASAAIGLLEGRNLPAPGSYSTLGQAYAMVGNLTGAQQEIARVEAEGDKGFGVGYDLALMYQAVGDRARALDALERAIDDHSQMLGYLLVDPAMDPLRDDPRARAVAQRIGLG